MWLFFLISAWATPAADSMALGDCAKVLSLLSQPATESERFAVGVCRVPQDPKAAITTLQGIDGPLHEYARWQTAIAEAQLGDFTGAVETSHGLRLPGEAGLQTRIQRAQWLIELNRSLEARPDLRALLETSVADEARYWLAIGGERRGEVDAAKATWKRLWVESTLGPWSGHAADHLAALGEPVPNLVTSGGRELLEERIRALTAARQHEAALARLDQLRTVKPARTRADHLFDAQLRFDGRDYLGAVSAFQAALGEPDTATGAADDLFNYALATARTGDYDTARLLYRRVIKQYPSSKQADFASYKLGYMYHDRGEWEKAIIEFSAHLERYPDSAYLDDTLWFSARASWKLNDRTTAVKKFDALLSKRPKSSLAPYAVYWKARADGLRGDLSSEKLALEDILVRWPSSGAAWFAAEKLNRSFPRQIPVERPPWPTPLAKLPEVQLGEALLAAGFPEWARDVWEPVWSLAATSGRDGALAAAHAAIAAGNYTRGQALAAPYCSSPWRGGDPIAQQACTPLPEPKIIMEIAERFQTPEHLPYGIMTAESALKPHVTSLAGARGLMQVMPVEAERLHREVFGEAPFDPDNLYLAPYNAALGTAELGIKGQSLRGSLKDSDLPAVIASYNGGETAVRRWLSAWEAPPEADEFSEDVGYPETRQYIRKVLGFIMNYRWVYGD